MSGHLRGLLTVLRRGRNDWSTFSRERIRAAFELPPGVEMPPLVVDPIEEVGADERKEDVEARTEPPTDSARLDRVCLYGSRPSDLRS